MNFETIIGDDIVDSDNGICVSVWFNGCDIRCKGCHNEKLWEPRETRTVEDVTTSIITALTKNGIKRSLSILGGEPLATFNRSDCAFICKKVKEALPDTYIRVWTGREWNEVVEEAEEDQDFQIILANADEFITGPYIESLRVTTIPLVGSSNQERRKFSRNSV